MYKCQDYHYQCPKKSELEKHINRMHDVKVYKCNFCRDEYKWEYSLKCHMKKHEGHDDEIGLPTKAYTPPLFTEPINISKLNPPMVIKYEMIVSMKNHVQFYIDSLQEHRTKKNY